MPRRKRTLDSGLALSTNGWIFVFGDFGVWIAVLCVSTVFTSNAHTERRSWSYVGNGSHSIQVTSSPQQLQDITPHRDFKKTMSITGKTEYLREFGKQVLALGASAGCFVLNIKDIDLSEPETQRSAVAFLCGI